MALSVRLREGKYLMVGGKIATHVDCCWCECCGDAIPEEFDVAISGVQDKWIEVGEYWCDCADEINGNYTLTPTANPCEWSYTGVNQFSCFGGTWNYNFLLLLTIVESGGVVTVTLSLFFGGVSAEVVFINTYDADEFSCCGLSAEPMTIDTNDDGWCDTSTIAAEITAVCA
jgi:hypothetical protein